MGRSKSIAEILPFWLDAVRLERGAFAFDNNRRWIKRFTDGFDGWGGMAKTEIANVGPKELLAYRSALAASLAPSTVNLYLMTAKRLVQWCAENEYRKPVMLTGVRVLQDDMERGDKAWTPEQVTAYLTKAQRFNRQAYLWNAIGYMGLFRPSETLALVLSRHKVGGHKAEQVSDGVWKIWGKTSYRSKLHRFLVLPPEGEALLAEAEPCWSSWKTYWQGSNAAMGVGPHRFRHSSIQHLQNLLGPEQISTVELLCGHYSQFKVLLKHYGKPQWQGLRKYGSMLAANVPACLTAGNEAA